MPGWPKAFDVAPRIADALGAGQPVVALESAVVSHGLPRSVGLQTAAGLEEIIRSAGAVPATIAIIDGRIRVGVPAGELERLTTADVMKVAARDLPLAIASAATGGVTVSAAIAVADFLGINVISTGGIGGVHLGAGETWDVSADLQTLARYPTAVVCAGAKAICDIGRTLEYLDTAGVTVVTFRADRFPNFYSLDSGFASPHRISAPEDAARILEVKRAIGQRTGLLVANPIPKGDALPPMQVQDAVRQATDRARAAGVRGGDLTPYLLSVLAEITAGAALRANIALLRANAMLAAEIAIALVRGGEE